MSEKFIEVRNLKWYCSDCQDRHLASIITSSNGLIVVAVISQWHTPLFGEVFHYDIVNNLGAKRVSWLIEVKHTDGLSATQSVLNELEERAIKTFNELVLVMAALNIKSLPKLDFPASIVDKSNQSLVVYKEKKFYE